MVSDISRESYLSGLKSWGSSSSSSSDSYQKEPSVCLFTVRNMTERGSTGFPGGGLKRTTSRGNLLAALPTRETPDSRHPEEDSKPSQAHGSTESGSNRSGGASEAPESVSLESSAPAAAPVEHSVSTPMPRLKRSRSMGAFDSLVAPSVSPGQQIVESISGKVRLPQGEQQGPPVTASAVPDGFDATKVPPRGHIASPHPPIESKQSPPAVSVSSADSSPPTQPPPIQNRSRSLAVSQPSAPQSGTDSAGLETPTQLAVSRSSRSPSPVDLGTPSADSPRGWDDSTLQHEPLTRVDYFSHDWNERDIADSWRYIVSRKQDMANSARLENASWRMWAKAKNHLRTLNPQEVNWLKDYDVTWLYGPLYHEPDTIYDAPSSGTSSSTSQSRASSRLLRASSSSRSSPVASTPPYMGPESAPAPSPGPSATAAAAPEPRKPKSILKKKSIALLMLEDASDLGLVEPGSTANYLRHHNYRHMPMGETRQHVADLLNRQYTILPAPRTSGNTSEAPESSPSGRTPGSGASGEPLRRPALSSHSSGRSVHSVNSSRSFASLTSLGSARSSGERHVHFNDRVEQCIALDPEGPLVNVSEGGSVDAPDSQGQVESHALGSSGLLSANSSNSAIHAIPGSPEDDGDAEWASLSDSESDSASDSDDSAAGGGLFLGLRRPSSIDDSECPIIAALPATTLKYQSDDEPQKPAEIVPDGGELNRRRPGFNANYDPQAGGEAPHAQYEIVDPTVKPVDLVASSPSASPTRDSRPVSADEPTLPPPKRRIRPVASFGT